jgi:hypothetical protein
VSSHGRTARRYETSIEPSPAGEEQMTTAGLEKGPYTAETYDVSLEEQYVVLEM